MTNGASISGQISIRLQVKYPSATNDGNSTIESSVNASAVAVAKQNWNQENSFKPPLENDPKSPKLKLSSTSASYSYERDNFLMSGADSPGSSKNPVSVSIIGNSTPGAGLFINTLPFRMTITSITAVDLKPKHTLVSNSPYVNAVYGTW